MHPISAFFAGLFLVNSLPHLASGLMGLPFPTPFAKPSGRGDSSPIVNVLWGSLNLLVAVLLLAWHPVVPGLSVDFVVMAAAFVILGAFTAHHFGTVRRNRRQG